MHRKLVSNSMLVVTVIALAGSSAIQREGPTMDVPRIYRIILPVSNIERAANFYAELLGLDGDRVSPGRHYFHGGEMILAVLDPRADGNDWDAHPNQDYIYLAVKNLETFHERATKLGGLSEKMGAIEKRPWGEVSFYMKDPFGNPLCFVDETTLFTGRNR